jgi:integrase
MAGKKLNSRKVETAGPGNYGDGDGLWLVVDKGGSRRWVYRFMIDGKASSMGLGSVKKVSLADARKLAAEAMHLVGSGISPVAARQAARRADAPPTFDQCAKDFLATRSAEWRSSQHAVEWRRSIERHGKAILDMPVADVDTEAILAVLKPIWLTTHETASRLRGRIENVIDAARARGFVDAHKANPARWRGHLDKLLPKRPQLDKAHYDAMPYEDVPGFVARLRKRHTIGGLALEFTILTAARTSEVVGARWLEFDVEKRVWTIPAARMKAGREHRVPLCERGIAILDYLRPASSSEFVFEGKKRGQGISTATMDKLLKRMEIDVTVHGFRSAFRDWVGNETHFPREIAEAALAHVVGNKVEAAYRRSDALEKRRALMQAWADYIERRPASTVVSIVGGKR